MPAFHNNLVHFKNKSFKGRAPLLSFSDNGSDSSSSEGDDKDNEEFFLGFENTKPQPPSLDYPVTPPPPTNTSNEYKASSLPSRKLQKKTLSRARQSSVDLSSLHTSSSTSTSSPSNQPLPSPLHELPLRKNDDNEDGDGNASSPQVVDDYGFFVDMPDETKPLEMLSVYDLSELNHVAIRLLPSYLTNLFGGSGWGSSKPPVPVPRRPPNPAPRPQRLNAPVAATPVRAKAVPSTIHKMPIGRRPIIMNYNKTRSASTSTSSTTSSLSSYSSSSLSSAVSAAMSTPPSTTSATARPSFPVMPFLNSLECGDDETSYNFITAAIMGELSLSSKSTNTNGNEEGGEPPENLPSCNSCSSPSFRKGRFTVTTLDTKRRKAADILGIRVEGR